ncbi:hypothetical protein ABW21_db0200526 [Orbilia brochopaga]|nr:hypothetical protein ABW21_db0200526 [Drechslerella brochopaga]
MERPDGTKNQVNWLADENMLPAALPNARIMRFGYDMMSYGGTLGLVLAYIASGLLDDLDAERQDCRYRPIIFVGHGFGGAVIQKAYNMAGMNEVEYPDIWRATTGIIFLGTPLRGSQHDQIRTYRLIVAHKLPTEEYIQSILEEDSEALVDIAKEFSSFVNVRPPSALVFCFFELKTTIVMSRMDNKPIQELLVDEAAGILYGHPCLGLPLDHFALNNYKGPKDRNYLRVRNEIISMAERSKELVESRIPSQAPPGSPERIPSPETTHAS